MASLGQQRFPLSSDGVSDHIVQFYESDTLLSDRVAEFIAAGLDAEDAAVIVATPPHVASIQEHLALRGIDVERAVARQRLVILDAEETLSKFMVGATPDAGLFKTAVGDLVGRLTAADGTTGLRAYGEMVDVLWKAGNHLGAIALEDLWNDLQRSSSFALLCSYAMGSFYKQAEGLQLVCERHDQVVAPDPSVLALSAELGQRRQIERALRASVQELQRNDAERVAYTKQAERLLGITAAMADAVTSEQVCEAVVDHVGAALGASSAALWVVREGAATAHLARASGHPDPARRALAALSTDVGAETPARDSIVTGRPIFIASQEELRAQYPHLAEMATAGWDYRIACLPLVVHHRTIGTLAFWFDGGDDQAGDDERGLLLLVARYAGQALERLRLLEAEQASRTAAEEVAARMALLYGLARSVIGAGSVEEVFDAALEAIGKALATDRSSILVFDDKGVMRFRSWRGLSDDYRRAVEGHSPWTRAARDPQPVIVEDVARDPNLASYLPLFRSEGIGAVAFIPLVAESGLLGKFMVYYRQPRVLARHELDLARAIADQVAAAVSRFAAVAELRQTVRFNEMFTGILGHDLRNPLNAIVTSARLAMMREGGEALVKPLSRILNSGDRMTRMIDQLLDLTRVRIGSGIPLGRQAIDLAPLIRQVMDELDEAHPDWTLNFEASGNTEGFWDADRLCQVFSNLIANALQHGRPEDGVTISADGTASDHVSVEVRNMGTVADELLPTIFEPLSGSTRRRDRSSGLGLGLYITREIVKSHQGEISARSSVEGGTVFRVVLPREVHAEIAR